MPSAEGHLLGSARCDDAFSGSRSCRRTRVARHDGQRDLFRAGYAYERVLEHRPCAPRHALQMAMQLGVRRIAVRTLRAVVLERVEASQKLDDVARTFAVQRSQGARR